MGQRLIHLPGRNLLVGSAEQENAVLAVFIYLDNRMARHAVRLSHKICIDSRFCQQFKQLFAVISSHRSRVPYLCACARHGDRLVQPFTSAEDFHAQRAHRFTGTNKMIYRIYVVNIQGTEIQYPHSFTSTFLLRLLSAPAGTGSLRTAASCV